MSENPEETPRTKTVLEQLNVGIMKSLEKKTGVCKIEMEPRGPADRHAVLMWEQRNTCFLPEDLKSFYLTSDGFLLTWCVKMDNGPMPLGRMHINRVSQLVRIGGGRATSGNSGSTGSSVNPSLADLEADSDLEDETSGLDKPTFDQRCKIYELDPCDGYGKVCLVYRENKAGMFFFDPMDMFDGKYTADLVRFGGNEPKVEIWFLDRALRWHYITNSFTAYYRLMLMHSGLPQWQYAFTDIGLSHQAKQWFNLYAPVRMELDSEIHVDGVLTTASPTASSTSLDVAKVFKGKSDKKKPAPSQTQTQQQTMKKKPVVSSAKAAPVTNNRTLGSTSQIQAKGLK